jgi:hypothetical protein
VQARSTLDALRAFKRNRKSQDPEISKLRIDPSGSSIHPEKTQTEPVFLLCYWFVKSHVDRRVH